MSSRTLYRWSGGTLIVGGLLGLVDSLLSAVLYPGHNATSQQILSTLWLIVASLFLAWALLLAMGLPGLYLRQAMRAGALGFAGFVLLSLGVLLGGVAFAAIQVFGFPIFAQLAPKGFGPGTQPPIAFFLLMIIGPVLLMAVGAILLGIATMRARVFPWGAGGLLLVAGIVSLVSIPIPVPSAVGNILEPLWNVVFFLALVWFGYSLMTQEQEAREAVAHPAAQVGVRQ